MCKEQSKREFEVKVQQSDPQTSPKGWLLLVDISDFKNHLSWSQDEKQYKKYVWTAILDFSRLVPHGQIKENGEKKTLCCYYNQTIYSDSWINQAMVI